MRKLVVDKNACIGCETCVSLVPKVFKLGHDGKVQVIDQNNDNQENIENAIDSCPVNAIKWEE